MVLALASKCEVSFILVYMHINAKTESACFPSECCSSARWFCCSVLEESAPERFPPCHKEGATACGAQITNQMNGKNSAARVPGTVPVIGQFERTEGNIHLLPDETFGLTTVLDANRRVVRS